MAKTRKRFTTTKLKVSWSLQDSAASDEVLKIEEALISKISKEIDEAILDEIVRGNAKLKIQIKKDIWKELEDALKKSDD